ncbi:MAG: hypothetical protein FWG89_02425 [Treponema sp.]|nr:hypothetical protein [Treponema sp.]
MKRMKLVVLAVAMTVVGGLVLIGCGSTPKSSAQRVSVYMEGTAWLWSSENSSSLFTFIDSTNFSVSYSGALADEFALISSDAITGTYSISEQTVTLIPNGSVLLSVTANGSIEVHTENSFQIHINNGTFEFYTNAYNREPVNMADTTWVWSSGENSVTYHFLDSAKYNVSYTGALSQFPLADSLAALGREIDESEIGTGTYSISDQTVTLFPAGGAYLSISSNGNRNLHFSNSYNISIRNNTFIIRVTSSIDRGGFIPETSTEEHIYRKID